MLNRRGFLVNASLAAVATGGGLTGCATAPVGAAPPLFPRTPVNLPPDSCHLSPVRVSADREIRTVVGLRPFRPSGFRVAVESFGETRVVHNYGHGGGGITLSWGTAKLAIDMGLPGHVGPVAVLGAGAVGLATARLCQQAGFDVTIYAKALPPNTTSNIAGGQWEPSFVFADAGRLTPEFTAQYVFACKFAYERYQILMDPRYGVRWMRNYLVSRRPLPPTMFDRAAGPVTARSATDALSPEGRLLRPEENPFGIGHAALFDGMLIETPIYLEAMLTDVRLAGGKVVVREMRTPADVQALPERLVFNCTGLGAKALFNDAEMTPLRGQLTILLPQPEVTYATSFENTYMFSRRDGVLLGGSYEMGDWSLEPNLETKAAILAKQAALFASMRTC